MPEDQNPGGTLVDGVRPQTTGVQTTLPNAPGWFASIARHPAQAVTLAGVLILGGLEAVQTAGGEDLEEQLEEKLKDAERAAEDRALLEQAAACDDQLGELAEAQEKFKSEMRTRDDDKFAYMSEIVEYIQALAAKLTKNPPKPSPRLEEYSRKGFARAIRNGDR